MAKYFLQRIFIALLTIFILVVATFFLVKLLPGDPFLDPKLPDETRQNMIEYYGLDKPVYIQFFQYLGNLVQGDLGYSLTYKNQTVNQVIANAFPKSMELGLIALVISLIIGLILGIISALQHNKALDYISMLIAIIGISVPSFIIGALFQYVFAVRLQWFPVAQWLGFEYTILPACALALGSVALIARLMRTSMLDIVSLDYVKTADAKGLSQAQITMRHQIRNALLPVLTVLGPLVARLVTGTFVIEQIFAIPGLGRHYVQSMQTLDYTMIMGLTIFFGAFLVVMNLLVDLSYGLVDPRIRARK
ncbi:ABC transporter permease [Bacillus horti]|uniref:Oligopeptide transport system permease protein n=1 Tax=Caldalkalibacillus horti TaxID=77523 RepID=A0ABT9W3Y9_9BACI|nr:ABC transporter permease [Bacillus horti]MDQ0167962.1 oligopeptide transport system permease protein [Bacillus horti]